MVRSNMSGAKVQWIVKGVDAQVRGPFSTEQVLHMISRGDLTGEEQISIFPGRDWRPISREPEFYDRLLEVLSKVQDDLDSHGDRFMGQTPVETSELNESPVAPEIDDKTPTMGIEAGEATEEDAANVVAFKGSKSRKRRKRKPEDIELVDLKGKVKREIVKRAATPALVAILIIFGAMYLLTPTKRDEDRIHLIEPRVGVAQLSADSVKAKTRKAVSHYLRDTFSEYLAAQNELVQIVEGDPKNHDVMALLCLTYFELWPYAFQDPADLRTIKAVTLAASSIDPAGLNSSTCKVVDLLVRGQMEQAKGLIEAVIDTQSQKGEPAIALFYLKAVVLDTENDPPSAIGYLKSAQRLWPQWIKAYLFEAEVQQKVPNYGEAVRLLNGVLQANPKHPVAQIDLGVIEYRQFNHPEKAASLIKSGLSSSDKAPRHKQSQGYLVLAEMALSQRKEKDALRLAKQAYALSPTNASAKNLILKLGGIEKLKSVDVKAEQFIYEGDQFAREGDFQSAQAHYKAAFKVDPKSATAAYKAAEALWKISFTTEAIEWLNKAIRADPKYIAAYVLLADFYTQRYNFQAAAKTLSTAERIAPKSYEVYRGFALVEFKRGNAAGAVTFAKKAATLYQTDVETHVLMSEAYVALKDYRLASSASAKAVEIDANYPRAHIAYAKSISGLQGVDVAIAYLSDRVRIFPIVMEYRVALAEMLLQDERYPEAETAFRETLAINPKTKAALLGLGRALRAQRNYKEAQEILLNAAVLDPTDPEPLFEAGLVYLEVNKPEEAAVQFDRVLKINPAFPRVNFHKGRASLLRGDGKAALQLAQEEMRINPNLADAYLLAADAYSQLGQFALCATEYQKAIRLRPQGAAIYVKVAQCYRQSGNVDVALAMLQHAEEQESGFAPIYKEQGQAYELKGDLVKAIEAYNQYFVLDPNAPDRAQIEQRIGSLRGK